MKKITSFLIAIPFVFLLTCCNSAGNGNGDSNLDYFIKDEWSFQNINSSLDMRNNVNYMLLEKAKLFDEADNSRLYLKAMKVKEYSRNLCDYIFRIKSELKSKAMNIPEKIADTLRSDLLADPSDTKIPAKYLIGSDPSNPDGQVKILKQKLQEYNDRLQQLTDSSGTGWFYQQTWQLRCQDLYSLRDKKFISWERYNFEGITMVAALARLSAIESDVKTEEGVAVMEIYSKTKVK